MNFLELAQLHLVTGTQPLPATVPPTPLAMFPDTVLFPVDVRGLAQPLLGKDIKFAFIEISSLTLPLRGLVDSTPSHLVTERDGEFWREELEIFE